MIKNVYILVGIPGSGKTTWAQKKILDFEKGTASICSADDYFNQSGQYIFDWKKLSEAHAFCMRNYIDAIIKGYDCVIVDKTNLSFEEIIPYYIIAKSGYVHNEYGKLGDWKYDVNLVQFKIEQEVAFKRQIHGVEEKSHKLMFEKQKKIKFPDYIKFSSIEYI